jgi:hypothetical protein
MQTETRAIVLLTEKPANTAAIRGLIQILLIVSLFHFNDSLLIARFLDATGGYLAVNVNLPIFDGAGGDSVC